MILAIYGSGGLGREVLDLAREINHVSNSWEDILFIDDTKTINEIINGCKTYPFEYFVNNFNIDDVEIVIALGEPSQREILYEKVKLNGLTLATLIHPAAHVGYGTQISDGTIVFRGAYISCNVTIGLNNVVLYNCTIAHDCIIGNHCVIAPQGTISGICRIDDGCYIGTGATVREKISIGENSVISLGSIVYKNVPKAAIYMSEPGRVIAQNSGKGIF